MTAKAKPDGYHTLTPMLTIEGAAQAIDFEVQETSLETVPVQTR